MPGPDWWGRKFSIFLRKMRIPRKNRNFQFSRRGNKEDYEMKRHSTSPPCGNLVDGLPHDCYTETMAKPSRLALAQNGKLMETFNELTMFCIMIEEKSHRISCPEYIEDLDKCHKRLKRQCHGQIHDISGLGKFRKNEKFWENFEKYRNFLFHKIER